MGKDEKHSAGRCAGHGSTPAAGRRAQASRIVVYPQAGHAFLADYRLHYRAADAQDGWRRMLD